MTLSSTPSWLSPETIPASFDFKIPNIWPYQKMQSCLKNQDAKKTTKQDLINSIWILFDECLQAKYPKATERAIKDALFFVKFIDESDDFFNANIIIDDRKNLNLAERILIYNWPSNMIALYWHNKNSFMCIFFHGNKTYNYAFKSDNADKSNFLLGAELGIINYEFPIADFPNDLRDYINNATKGDSL